MSHSPTGIGGVCISHKRVARHEARNWRKLAIDAISEKMQGCESVTDLVGWIGVLLPKKRAQNKGFWGKLNKDCLKNLILHLKSTLLNQA